MHAVVATVRIADVAAARQSLAGLRVGIVPRAAGFVCAYWLEPVGDVGLSFVVFDTREHAEQAAAHPLPALPGVTPMTPGDPRGIRKRLTAARLSQCAAAGCAGRGSGRSTM